MGSDEKQLWFVKVDEKSYGPFSVLQLKGLIENKNLTWNDFATSDHLKGKWITLREVFGKPVQLPSRPDALFSQSTMIEKSENGDFLSPTSLHPLHSNDALFGLVDALKAAKEKASSSSSSSHFNPVHSHASNQTQMSGGLDIQTKHRLVFGSGLTLISVLGFILFRILNPEQSSIPQEAKREIASVHEQENEKEKPKPNSSPSLQSKTASSPTSKLNLVNAKPASPHNSDPHKITTEKDDQKDKERDRDKEPDFRDRDRDSQEKDRDSRDKVNDRPKESDNSKDTSAEREPQSIHPRSNPMNSTDPFGGPPVLPPEQPEQPEQDDE